MSAAAMDRRLAAWAAPLLWAAATARPGEAALAAGAPRRPNIVWIMADDLGWGEVGLFPANSTHGRLDTPHLDQLGREGVVFSDAYAGYTVCAPSRTAFFTGRHSGHFHKLGIDGASIAPEQNVTTLAQMLQSAGYATGAFGKVAPLTAPMQQGFDAFLGQVDQALCHNMYPREIDFEHGQLNFKLEGNFAPKNRDLCMAHPENYNYTIDVFHAAGMSWLENVARSAKPFFLYLAYTIPHPGGWADAPDSPEDGNPVPTDLQYADREWPAVERDHAAVVSYLDIKVGDVVKRLRSLGLEEKTLVIFASDNGAHQEGGHHVGFFDSTGGLRGYKRSLFEGGTRSPSMAWWPGTISPGRRSSFQWAFWDAWPTLAELAGAEMPGGSDGVSIVPTLLGEAQDEREYLFWTWPGAGAGPSGYAVRVGPWKGVVPHCTSSAGELRPRPGDEMQLYHLASDPGEATDVASAHPGVAASLRRLVASKNVTCDCFQCDIRRLGSGPGAARSGPPQAKFV